MKKASYLAMILSLFLFGSCSGESEPDSVEDAAEETEQAVDAEIQSY